VLQRLGARLASRRTRSRYAASSLPLGPDGKGEQAPLLPAIAWPQHKSERLTASARCERGVPYEDRDGCSSGPTTSVAGSYIRPPVSDALDRLREVVAVQDGRSHVGPARRLRIGGLILQVEDEELSATARRLVAALPAEDLAAIVTDWLEAQIAS
jgi:hypothetical protein